MAMARNTIIIRVLAGCSKQAVSAGDPRRRLLAPAFPLLALAREV